MDKLNIDYKAKLETFKKNIDGLTDGNIGVRHKDVADWIETRKTANTQSAYYNALVMILRARGKKYQQLSNTYSIKASELRKTENIKEGEQQRSEKEKEKYLNYQQLIALRTKFEKNKNDSWAEHFQYLVLALYTEQPPIRLEYKNMRICHKKPLLPKKDSKTEDRHNYLVFIENRAIIILDNHKNYETYGRKEITMKHAAYNVMKESLKEFPRDYVFTQLKPCNGAIPMDSQSNTSKNLLKFIARIDNKNLGVDMFRLAYVTHFYSIKQNNLNHKEQLASEMNHSVKTAERHYFKNDIDDTPEINELKAEKMEKIQDVKEIKEAKEIKDDSTRPVQKQKREFVKDGHFDKPAYDKYYREKNAIEFRKTSLEYYNKNKKIAGAKGILRSLSYGNSKVPRQETIEKHELYKDQDGKWHSKIVDAHEKAKKSTKAAKVVIKKAFSVAKKVPAAKPVNVQKEKPVVAAVKKAVPVVNFDNDEDESAVEALMKGIKEAKPNEIDASDIIKGKRERLRAMFYML